VKGREWEPRESDVEEIARLSVEAEISPLLARLLLNRGIRDAVQARRFLSPSFADLHDPSLLPGFAPAVERLRRALDQGERIVIYGDYDVDGTTATALLIGVLRRLGGDVHYYIPDRQTEGYGMHVAAMRRIKEECDPSLLLTVDCGITAREPIAEAHRLGVDVIVTDHHTVDAQRLPPAESVVALINPKLDGQRYPFPDLAGVGLAFKLAQGVIGCSLENPDPLLTAQLDLVALGTIADVAPLQNENRALAKLGLEAMTRRERLGVRALCAVAGIRPDSPLTAYDVGFKLGPRINAAGRLDTAHKVVTLLTTDSESEATHIAQTLNDENASRQLIQNRITEEAVELIEKKNLSKERAIFLDKEGWHEGVIGIVASRLVARYNRPVVLVALKGEIGKGSGRSIPPFHLSKALEECRSLLLNFGGHAAAAGLTVERQAVAQLRKRFLRTANEWLSPEDLKPRLPLDAILTLDALTLDAVRELERLEPTGDGNPPPKLGVRGLRLAREPLLMGTERRHVKVTLTDGRDLLTAVRWNGADDLPSLRIAGAEIDVAGTVSVNEYQGTLSVQMTVDDWAILPPGSLVERGIFPRREHPAWVKIVDSRGRRDKSAYPQRLLERGEPTLLYVRDETAANEIRNEMDGHDFVEATPHLPPESIREAVDRLLAGTPPVLLAQVSVTPFAEPNAWRTLRHIVFSYPLPDERAFVERSRPLTYRWQETPPHPEEAAYVHLLFTEEDVAAESKRLERHHPPAETLRQAARTLRSSTREKKTLPTLEEWASASHLEPTTTQVIADILAELGFVERVSVEGVTRYRWLDGAHRRLEESPRYRESLIARRRWELMASRWLRATARDFWEALRPHALDTGRVHE